jgi:hypothetical protein
MIVDVDRYGHFRLDDAFVQSYSSRPVPWGFGALSWVKQLAERSIRNGEPGYFWLDTARAYGRMKDAPDESDSGACGSNPCAEQTLWDRELCCPVETYPTHHANLEAAC